ncbi:MAG: tetratricopeptide repeat protein [Gemmatimonadetes bacterium]|nr:tetratricopeptide repeat protein [Gemmatimonadota bacterium]MBT5143862.1 tetratricopeptide repeat protein [Gemmatimonadota bacterium]MBT5590628.1 tetratricopeptide repeat protein [Gemmatimonadota bacterium]MBT5965501.1 tetratricopeptide repeat protein [Gemmatimonadota bacterium]MBT6630645.1 tetratricopeptide repeat protein [Gemmatimonadota bacterium]
MRLQLPHWLTLSLVAVLLSSCVYFNTFYNAEKFFRQAEKSRAEFERSQRNRTANQRGRQTYEGLYEKAVRKASLVLDKHRESELVDDAMFLIGRALYWKRDYQYSSRSLQDLEDNFPESEFFDQARYWRALCLAELSRAEEARALFRSLMSDRSPEVGALSGLQLGQMSDNDEDWGASILQYQATLDAFPKSNLASQLWLRIGRAHMQFGDLARVDSSLAAFDAALETDPPDSVEYRARLLRGQALQAKGEAEASLHVYERLLREGRFRGWEGETRLLIGDYHRERADLTSALAEFEQIRDDFPLSDVSARALYETGLLYLQEEGDRVLAAEYLAEVGKEKRGSVADSLAKEMVKTFTALDELLESVFEADSLAAAELRPQDADSLVVSDTVTVQDAVVEPTSIQVGDNLTSIAANDSMAAEQDADSLVVSDTVTAQDAVLEPTTADSVMIDSLVTRTSLPVAAATRTSRPDPAAEDTASYLPAFDEEGQWQPLVTRPSLREDEDEDEDAARAQRIQDARNRRQPRNGQRLQNLEDQLFSVAELYREALGQADSAALYYDVLSHRFPRSPHVPRALWNLAWVHTTLRNDADAAAPFMQRLIEDFPTSVHAGAARQYLGLPSVPSAEDLAAQEFERLETIRLQRPEHVEEWLLAMDRLVQAFPRTLTAAKAAFVSARALESARPDDSVAVESRFARIGDEYGHTQFGELVRARTISRRDGAVARLERELQRLGEGTRPGERLILLAVEPTEDDTIGFSKKFLSLGMRALRRGQYERASEWFELSLEEATKRNGQAYTGMGEAAWRQGYFADAIEHFRTGMTSGSTSVLSFYRLFDYHVREDQVDSANHYLRMVLRQDRNNLALHAINDRFPTLVRAEPEEIEIADLETVDIEPDESAFELAAGFFGVVEEPFVRESVTPLYPAEAQGDSAQVIVDILINEDGEPELLEVFSGEEPFVSAAMVAVRKYRFYAAEGRNELLLPVWAELALTLKPPSLTPPAIADAGEPGSAPE